MSKECIDNCPFIKEVVGSINTRNFLSGPMAFHPDLFMGDNTQRLLEVCKATYDCPGPEFVNTPVAKGIFKIHMEYETQTRCPLAERLGRKP